MRTYAASHMQLVNLAEVCPGHSSVSATADIVADAHRLDAPRSIRGAGINTSFFCETIPPLARLQGDLRRPMALRHLHNTARHSLTCGHAPP